MLHLVMGFGFVMENDFSSSENSTPEGITLWINYIWHFYVYLYWGVSKQLLFHFPL